MNPGDWLPRNKPLSCQNKTNPLRILTWFCPAISWMKVQPPKGLKAINSRLTIRTQLKHAAPASSLTPIGCITLNRLQFDSRTLAAFSLLISTRCNSFHFPVSNPLETIGKPMRRSAFLSACFALVPGLLSLSAAGQSGSFIVAQHGKPVGTATVTFTATPHGYGSTSFVRIAMQGLNYALSKTERSPPATNSARAVERHSQRLGRQPSPPRPTPPSSCSTSPPTAIAPPARLAQHPAAVFLPDFDPGAFDTLLALAVARNNRDLWAIIPKSGDRPAPSSPSIWPPTPTNRAHSTASP